MVRSIVIRVVGLASRVVMSVELPSKLELMIVRSKLIVSLSRVMRKGRRVAIYVTCVWFLSCPMAVGLTKQVYYAAASTMKIAINVTI